MLARFGGNLQLSLKIAAFIKNTAVFAVFILKKFFRKVHCR